MSRFTRARPRTVAAVVGAVALVAVGGVAARAAIGGESREARPLAAAVHDALSAPKPAGVTAHFQATSDLLPSGSALDQGEALFGRASGVARVRDDGRFRVDLTTVLGAVRIAGDSKAISLYRPGTDEVYRLTVPEHQQPAGSDHEIPGLGVIGQALNRIARYADLSQAEPSTVAGEQAYTLRISPKHDGGLIGRAELAWDAARGIPLRAALYAEGSSTPVLELTARDVEYGRMSDAELSLGAPAGARVVDLQSLDALRVKDAVGDHLAVTSGLDAVRDAASFDVAAPAQLVGLERRAVELIDADGTPTVVAVYGTGLGALVVVQRPHGEGSTLPAILPAVSIAGATGRELATALGTAVAFTHGGVDYVLAGSLPAVAAETAARDLVAG